MFNYRNLNTVSNIAQKRKDISLEQSLNPNTRYELSEKYYGKAFYSLKDFIEIIREDKTKHRTEYTWDELQHYKYFYPIEEERELKCSPTPVEEYWVRTISELKCRIINTSYDINCDRNLLKEVEDKLKEFELHRKDRTINGRVYNKYAFKAEFFRLKDKLVQGALSLKINKNNLSIQNHDYSVAINEFKSLYPNYKSIPDTILKPRFKRAVCEDSGDCVEEDVKNI